MTDNQKSAIIQKIGRPEGWNISNPKELRPYLLAIYNSMDRISTEDGSKLMDAIYTIHACDRNPQPYSYNWSQENDGAYESLKKILKDNMIPQVCELCGIGEDSLKVDRVRVCQECVTRIKSKATTK